MKSLRLALTATHLPLQGRQIPPACLNEAHLPLQGRRIPPACLDGNPPPFTREAESLRLAASPPHNPFGVTARNFK